VLTKRTHLELPGVKALKRGFRLLPASAYPDESHGQPGAQHPGALHLGAQHPDGLLPGGELPGAVPLGGHFPGVDLMDSHVPQAGFPAADLADAGPAWAEPSLTAQPGPGHPSADPGAGHPASAEPDHPSASWWEKPQPGRA
jgi:hypothetical protein